MVVHRRCRTKVGDYCGWKENARELYQKWREEVNSVLFPPFLLLDGEIALASERGRLQLPVQRRSVFDLFDVGSTLDERTDSATGNRAHLEVLPAEHHRRLSTRSDRIPANVGQRNDRSGASSLSFSLSRHIILSIASLDRSTWFVTAGISTR